MHELSITQEIVRIALAKARDAAAEKIVSVRVKVGEFTAVEAECLQFYFGALTADTPAAGAELAVETVPLAARCSSCHRPFVPQNFSFRCPACKSAEVEITSGRELYVESIEVR